MNLEYSALIADNELWILCLKADIELWIFCLIADNELWIFYLIADNELWIFFAMNCIIKVIAHEWFLACTMTNLMNCHTGTDEL